jgi:phosphoribosylformylglycinamidine synthase
MAGQVVDKSAKEIAPKQHYPNEHLHFCTGKSSLSLSPSPSLVMKFKAEIDVMPLKALLDPQGKAVTGSMKNLGLPEIENVRIGKHITLEIEAASKDVAKTKVDEACKKLLANQIMEFYEFEIDEIK